MNIETEFKTVAQNYKRFQQSSETQKVTVGTERYGFLWLFKRDIYENRTYTYANVHQTIDQLAEMAIELEGKLKLSYDEIMKLDSLTRELKTAILKMHDLSDERFDVNDVITPVQKTINKISLPTFDLDSGIYRERITDQFGLGRVEGNNVQALMKLFYDQIDLLLKETFLKMQSKLQEVEQTLDHINVEFINDVLKESESRRDKLQRSILNRDQEIEQYEKVVAVLEQDIQALRMYASNNIVLV